MMTSMTQKMLPRRVDGFGNVIVPDYPSVDTLMKIGNPENTRHHRHFVNLIKSAYDGKDDVEDMMHAMNEAHGGAWYDDLWSGIKDVGSFLWNNKDDIISVAKMVAPLVGAGMEFDDAYEDVVGGSVARYAHTLAELKHFTFPALQAYIKKINKHFKYDPENVPENETKYMSGIKDLKKKRLTQKKRSPKVWTKSEAIREKYMESNQPSLGLFLPRSKSRKSGHISRTEAQEVNIDLTKENRTAIKNAKKALTDDEYEQLIDEIDDIHRKGGTRMAFNKAVREALIDLDISAPKSKAPSRRASVVVPKAPSRRASVASIIDVPKPARKPTMAGAPKTTVSKDLGKANQNAILQAKKVLNDREFTNLLVDIGKAHQDTKGPLQFNKAAKQIILENGLSIGKLTGYTSPRKSPDLDEVYYLPPPDYPHPDDELDEFGNLPPPPPLEKLGVGRPRRRTTRKKSTRKPTKKSKKSRKVRLI
jgi:hypothetical protein